MTIFLFKCIRHNNLYTFNMSMKHRILILNILLIWTYSGFDDILFGIPVTQSKINRLSKLNQTHDIKLLINNLQMIAPLEAESKRTNRKWKLLIEVSTGYQVNYRSFSGISHMKFLANWTGHWKTFCCDFWSCRSNPEKSRMFWICWILFPLRPFIFPWSRC